ncbi:hypothetical protein [Nocardia sp. NBC_01388]|uniref:hypothetical protein n=1 Tax=Nocardia sp. NBC_01388 TaxID=2903596 RepID=UPI003254F63F
MTAPSSDGISCPGAVVVGHRKHRGADQINQPATGIFLDKLTQWKGADCCIPGGCRSPAMPEEPVLIRR